MTFSNVTYIKKTCDTKQETELDMCKVNKIIAQKDVVAMLEILCK